MEDRAERKHEGHPEELTRRFVDLMEQVSVGLRPKLLEVWSEIELTMHQFRTVALLQSGPQRISDIAAHLGIRLSAATNFVDRLEGKKLVRRIHDSEDRRVVRIHLTSLGKKEAEALWQIDRTQVRDLALLLEPGELESVTGALEVLLSTMRRQAQSGLWDPAAPRRPGREP